MISLFTFHFSLFTYKNARYKTLPRQTRTIRRKCRRAFRRAFANAAFGFRQTASADYRAGAGKRKNSRCLFERFASRRADRRTACHYSEAEEVDVQINQNDLRIDTFCSSGPGGQSVNTTYSAVRITHLPTNTVVSMQDEKSQIKNREKAMRVLRARLQEIEEQKQHDAQASERKSMVGSGDRSEKIRTYNFKENRVSDHRIGLTVHQLDLVMEGALDEFIEALTTHYQTEKLKADTVAA